MTVPRVRLATAADLPRIAAIWYQAQVDADDDIQHPAPHLPSLYRHELEQRELHVLERNGEVLAFGAVLERGTLSFLADLFVDRAHRSTGLGATLLQHLLKERSGPICTVSSSDARALALYVRAGLQPTWPHLSLLAETASLRPLPPQQLDVIPAQPNDPLLATWDAEISGRARPQDHAYWIRHRGAVPLWFRQRDRVVGYAYAQTRSDDLLEYPEAITLGPLGVQSARCAEGCVYAAVEWARQRAQAIRIAVTGPHPALGSLLAAGFRFAEVETFCATDGAPVVDVRRYISSGGDLF